MGVLNVGAGFGGLVGEGLLLVNGVIGMPRAQIKDEEMYRALRREGNSKEKSARIANAAADSSRSKVGKRGGKSGSYDDMNKDQLVKRARKIGIKGARSMRKSQLIDAMRHH